MGSCDLFHDETLAYAARLAEAGVACQLQVVPGAYHAFDRVSEHAPVVEAFRQSYLDALAEVRDQP